MLPSRPSLRLLPLTIAALIVLLSMKCIDVVRAVALPHLGISTAVVQAAEAAPAGSPVAATDPKPAPPAAVEKPVDPAPPEVSEAERTLLQDLRGRRLELEKRDASLGVRQQALDAAEQRLTGRLDELTALQSRLEQLEAERRAHDETNWRGLVKLYEAMKPRDAAAIFNDMEMPVLLPVLDRMKDTKAAAILAAMLPDRARLATAQLAALRTQAVTVPPPRPLSGS